MIIYSIYKNGKKEFNVSNNNIFIRDSFYYVPIRSTLEFFGFTVTL